MSCSRREPAFVRQRAFCWPSRRSTRRERNNAPVSDWPTRRASCGRRGGARFRRLHASARDNTIAVYIARDSGMQTAGAFYVSCRRLSDDTPSRVAFNTHAASMTGMHHCLFPEPHCALRKPSLKRKRSGVGCVMVERSHGVKNWTACRPLLTVVACLPLARVRNIGA